MSMWNIQYVELRSPEKIESDRQERIRKNKEYFASGQKFYDRNHAVHYARFNSVDTIDGDVEYFRGNQGDGNMSVDYYIRAAKKLGLTVEQAAKASRRGAEAGSGKIRDNMVRSFQDLNDGGNRANQYAVNRKLAAKVTASSYARMGSSEKSYYDQMPNVFNFAKQASDEAGRIEDIAIELRRVQEETIRIAEENRVRIEMERELKIIEEKRIIEEKIISQEKIISDQKIAQQLLLIQNQTVTFEEQVNSGDYNETPITDIIIHDNIKCNGCDVDIHNLPPDNWVIPDDFYDIPNKEKEGYHRMPDGSLMKDSDMEKEPLNNNMKMAGIAGIGIIGLLLYSRSVKK